MPSAPPAQFGVAYLVSEYPKLSHSFVASEIAGLRRAGARVDTYSVRTTDAGELRTERDRAEAAATTYLIADVRHHLPALLLFGLRRPDVLARGLYEALRFCAPNVRGRSFFYLLEALALVRRMAPREARHLHVHLSNNAADVAHLAVTMGRRLDGRRWSWSLAVHGPNELVDVRAYNLARKAASADFVACITDYCRSQVMTLLPRARWGDLHVVRMGIDLQRFAPVERARGAEEPTRVLFVGRLVAEKAPQLLLESVARLPVGVLELRVVGSGPLADELADLAVQLGIAAHVQLVGAASQDELPEHYAWADVFCLPSFAEGLPVVLMEAMATGLPVVSTQIAGIPELVSDGANGLLVAPGNVASLTAALDRLRDGVARQRLGEHAREAVRQAHEADVNAAGLFDLVSAARGPA